jgi:hypothetical protein
VYVVVVGGYQELRYVDEIINLGLEQRTSAVTIVPLLFPWHPIAENENGTLGLS